MRRNISTQRQPNRPRRVAQEPKRPWWLYVFIPGMLVVAVGAAISLMPKGGATQGSLQADVSWPPYVRNAASPVRQAYAYVVDHSNMQYIPCYCGCGQHAGHTSVHDCFVQRSHAQGGPAAFDDHGANCDMCVQIVLDVERLVKSGKTMGEARQYVTARYGDIGPATNTPPIP